MTTERPTGAGAPINDPQAQIDQIEQVLAVLEEIGHPRIKPIKKKLRRALARVGEGAESGRDAEVIAKQLATDLRDLRRATYDLLTTVVNQLRGTLRVKKAELSPAERQDAERLMHGLGLFAKAMNKMTTASRKDDAEGRDRAIGLMNEAHAAMGTAPTGE